MSNNAEVRKFSFVSPPRAYGPTGPVGQEIVFPVTLSAEVVNLEIQTFGLKYDASQVQNEQGVGAPTGQAIGLVGSYITIYADGADLGIIIGATIASVSGGAAPNLAAKGSLGATGVYTPATGTCHRIPAGQERRYLTQVGQDNFLGVVGSATGACRLYQSSGYGLV